MNKNVIAATAAVTPKKMPQYRQAPLPVRLTKSAIAAGKVTTTIAASTYSNDLEEPERRVSSATISTAVAKRKTQLAKLSTPLTRRRLTNRA